MNIFLTAGFVNAFGYFFLMSVMAILFVGAPFHFTAGKIAFLLGLLALADQGFALLWMPVIQHISYRQGILMAILSISASLMGIAKVPHFTACVIFLFLFGLGSSLAGLSIRLWVSSFVDEKARITGFGSLYRMYNAAGGLAPLLAFAFLRHDYGRFVFALSSLFYLCGGSIIFFFFNEHARPTEQPLSIRDLGRSIVTQFESYRGSLPIFLVIFCFMYFFTQYHLLPFYFKQYDYLPSNIGFAFALNPFLIVLLQGWFSKIFFWLHQRKLFSPIVIAFAFTSMASLSMYFASNPYRIWMFVISITIGEMLLAPQFDFLLSQRTTPTIRPLVFALSGIVWAVSRSIGESGGVMMLSGLSIHHWNPSLWWLMNGLLAAIVFCVGGVLMQRRSSRLDV